MTILSFSSFVSTTFLFLSLSSSTAFPTGAGTCLTGDGAPLGHSGALSGSVEDSGSFKFSVDGTELPGDHVHYMPGTDHVLKIEGVDGATFKGFLLRASSSGSDEDLSGSLTNPSDNSDFQIMLSTGEANGSFPTPGTCAETVAGACHTATDGAATAKTSVEVTFTPPSDQAVKLELTIMVTGAMYHYSSYMLTVEGGEDEKTDAPASSPDEEDGDSSATFVSATSSMIMISTLASMAFGSFF